MMIETYSVGFKNKGAQLMLLAIIEEFKKRNIQAKFAAVPQNDYLQYAQLGFYQKTEELTKGLPFDDMCGLIPKKLLLNYGLVTSKDIDVILDGSGLAYTDQLSSQNCKVTAKMYKKQKKRGKKIIMLPQAFGPFENKKIAKYTKEIVQNADIVFAREKTSYDNLMSIVFDEDKKKIKVSPDFTTVLKGKCPEYFKKESSVIAIVPNKQMIEKTDKKTANIYINGLKKTIELLLKYKLDPFFLIFEGNSDLEIAKKINQEMDINLKIIKEDNAIFAKGIIGECQGVISSRFHALSCSLSQAVPSIGMGWSHKYQELFNDYNTPEYLIPCDDNLIEKVEERILVFLDKQLQKDVSKRLRKSSFQINEQTSLMWDEVFNNFISED